MLEITGLSRTVGRRRILADVSLRVAAGSTLAVLGPSGSGKTTLLRLVMGLDAPDAGEITLAGRRLNGPGAGVPPEHRGISMVFQEFTLFPHLDVEANVVFGVGRARHLPALDELLALLEIGHLRRRRVDDLSGGEQQRVALARSLAVRPRLLLLDEPFSNVDHALRERLYERFKAHLVTHGVTTIVATHDHHEAFYFGDRLLVLRDGSVLDAGEPRRVYHEPANAWVARFFGEANLVAGRELEALAPHHSPDPGATYFLRPEAFEVIDETAAFPAGTVEAADYYGAYQSLRVRLDAGLTVRVREQACTPLGSGERVSLRVREGARPRPVPDSWLHGSSSNGSTR